MSKLLDNLSANNYRVKRVDAVEMIHNSSMNRWT